jgi:hypothetical protein
MRRRAAPGDFRHPLGISVERAGSIGVSVGTSPDSVMPLRGASRSCRSTVGCAGTVPGVARDRILIADPAGDRIPVLGAG